jgi:hypothetical protein
MRPWYSADAGVTWTEIVGGLVSPISHMLDTTPTCAVSVADAEGSLYPTFATAQGYPAKVTDDAGTTDLLIGRIAEVTPGAYAIQFRFEGGSAALDDDQMNENFIKGTAKIKTVAPGADVSRLELCEDTTDGAAFAWANDHWNSGNQDNAIMVSDQTGNVVYTWTPSVVAEDVAPYHPGESTPDPPTAARAVTENDGLENKWKESTPAFTPASGTKVIFVTMSGTAIPTSSYLQKISARVRVYVAAVGAFTGGGLYTPASISYYLLVRDKGGNGTVYHRGETYRVLASGSCAVGYRAGGSASSWVAVTTPDMTGWYLEKLLNVVGANYTTSDVLVYYTYAIGAAGGQAADVELWLDVVSLTVDTKPVDFAPILATITDTLAPSTVDCGTHDFVAEGVNVGDKIIIATGTKVIAAAACAVAGVGCDADPLFDAYIAEDLTMSSPRDAIEKVCVTEGAHWWEEYRAGKCFVVLRRVANFLPSGYVVGSPLTSADFGSNFKIQLPNNQYKAVRGQGSPKLGLYWTETDTATTNTSQRIYPLREDKFLTLGALRAACYNKLQEIKVVRPSVSLACSGVAYLSAWPGHTAYLTVERPTIANASYPVRKLTISQPPGGGLLSVEVALGLGSTPAEEEVGKALSKLRRDIRSREQSAMLPYVGGTKPSYNHSEMLDPNGSADVQHLTAAQVAALHAAVTAGTRISVAGQQVSADAQVEDSIADGHTTIAPSGNAVFDALALKLALAGGTMTGNLVFTAGKGITQPYCYLTRNAVQSIANAAMDYVLWDTEQSDLLGMHAANSAEIVIPSAGLWDIQTSVLFDADTDGGRILVIQICPSGGAYGNVTFVSIDAVHDATFSTGVHSSITVLLGVGDKVRVGVYHSAGAALNIYGGAEYTYVTLTRRATGASTS